MNILVLLLLLVISWCSGTVNAGTMYEQNVYMFPDDVINASKQGCDDNQPVKQSRFFYPEQKQQNYEPQSQPYRYPSANQASRNIAYVSDTYKTQPYNPLAHALTAQRDINDEGFEKRITVNSNDQFISSFQLEKSPQLAGSLQLSGSPQLVLEKNSQPGLEKSSQLIRRPPMDRVRTRIPKLLYVSDIEPDVYSNTFPRLNRQFSQREKIRYVFVPVYVYKMPGIPSGHFPGDTSYNELLSGHYINQDYNFFGRSNYNLQNKGFEPFSGMTPYDMSDYGLTNKAYAMAAGLQNNSDAPYAINPIIDSEFFSLPDNNHLRSNMLDKYSSISSNDEFYNPSAMLKLNSPGIDLFPGSAYMLNP